MAWDGVIVALLCISLRLVRLRTFSWICWPRYFGEMSLRVLWPIFTSRYLGFCRRIVGISYVFDTDSFLDIWLARIFFCSIGWLFSLWVVCCAEVFYFCFNFFKFFFLSFWLFRASPTARGVSQARGLIRAVATILRHSHTRPKLRLQPMPQFMAAPDP